MEFGDDADVYRVDQITEWAPRLDTAPELKEELMTTGGRERESRERTERAL